MINSFNNRKSNNEVDYTKKSDNELLALLEKDSLIAFEILYIRYKNKLQRFCLFLLKSSTVAQDVTQEVFIKVWLSRSKLNTQQSFSNYLYTLAKNHSLNELRSAKRKELMESIIKQNEKISEIESGETQLILKEYKALLKTAIEQLPENKRKIFKMSRYEGFTHKEIAEVMGLSPHTVQSHISDSLRFMSDYFLKHADLELYLIFIVLYTNS